MFESSHPDKLKAQQVAGPFLSVSSMYYYVYIIESMTTGQWYIGFSENLDQRILDHQTNRSKYTRFKGPWKLIFKMIFENKTEALFFESYLKKSRNKGFIRRKFAANFLV